MSKELVVMDSVVLNAIHRTACEATFLRYALSGWVAWLDLDGSSYQVLIRDEIDSWVQSSIMGDESTWYDDAKFSRSQHDELMESATFDPHN